MQGSYESFKVYLVFFLSSWNFETDIDISLFCCSDDAHCKFMLHCKQPFNYSNSTVFAGTVIPSPYNFSVTTGYTMTMRRPLDVVLPFRSRTTGQLHVTIVLPSCRDNSRDHRWSREVKAKVKRTDVHTKNTRRTRWPHEVNTNLNLREDLR